MVAPHPPIPPRGPSRARCRTRGGRRLGRVLLLALLLPACEGSNLFRVGPIPLVPSAGEGFRAQVLRFFEEGTLLTDDGTPLRFRWAEAEPRLTFAPGVPERERMAFLRGVGEIQAAGGPLIPVVTASPTIRVESFPPDQYRLLDPTRPWSFSRTYVTATDEAGIREVEILLSLDLPQAELERAALHALGHAVGIMGHPAFPGDRTVMATRPEGGVVPTRFAPVEREAIRFLYAPGVRAGMTRSEIRREFQGFFISEEGG